MLFSWVIYLPILVYFCWVYLFGFSFVGLFGWLGWISLLCISYLLRKRHAFSLCSLPFPSTFLCFNGCFSFIIEKNPSSFKYIINNNDLLSWSDQVHHVSKNQCTLKFVFLDVGSVTQYSLVQ